MRSFILLNLLVYTFNVFSQDSQCADKIQNAPGRWGKISHTEGAPPSELVIQKKFLNAVNANLESSYSPQHLQADRSFWHERKIPNHLVTAYGLTIYGMQYSCDGEALTLNHETSTKMMTQFNMFTYAEFNEPPIDDGLTGFHRLTRGMPVEVSPGIQEFPVKKVSLGFGMDGDSKLWLITYDGKLPWSYVTRQEFLLKRKQVMQRQKDEETSRYNEGIKFWETQKKLKEQEVKNDAAKLTAFINGTYNPGVERTKSNYNKAVKEWDVAIDFVSNQLNSSPIELARPAIVARDSKNFRLYDFVESTDPFAEILIKPNPSYFNRGLGLSIPQLITVEIIYNPKDKVAAKFGNDTHAALNLSYLRSFIGKSAPGPNPGKVANQPKASDASTGGAVTANSKADAPTIPAKNTSNNTTTNVPARATVSSSATSKTLKLSGLLRAPAGASVNLQVSTDNEVVVTAPKTNLYTTVPVVFPKPVAEASPYKVELKKIPSGMKGMVYHADANNSGPSDKLRVAVDYNYELITRSTGDKVFSTFYESFAPAIGGSDGEEGRYVVFLSLTKGFEESDGKYRQVYWRDRNTGVTKMVSRSASGEQSNGDCFEPSISVDGQTVVFESRATNLANGDNNNARDVFAWRASTNSIELVSAAGNGNPADMESFDATVSGNGQHVVFTSSANNLVGVPKGRSISNIFIRDLEGRRTEMISIDPTQRAGGNGYRGSISFDGSRVSFCSPSGTLTPGDNNNLWDIFVWQRGQAMLKRVSLTHDGKERNAGSESASRQVSSTISGDGKFVAFATTANNMVPGDNNIFQDVFVVEVESGKVSVASFTTDGLPSNGDSPIDQGERVAISFDGTWVAFPTKATNLGVQSSNIVLHNTVTGKKQIISDERGSYVGRPAISKTGSYVVFGKSTNLDKRYPQTGIFAHFTGNGLCRDCKD